MCCSLDVSQGSLIINHINATRNSSGDLQHISIKATLDHTPPDLAHRVLKFFQNLDLVEKIAHAVDEAFHFLREFLRRFCSFEIFNFAQEIHHAGHRIEHSLHALCFFGDLSAIWAKKYVAYHTHRHHGHVHREGIDVIQTCSRIAFTISHFFATTEFFNELKIIRVGNLEPFVKCKNILNGIGFSLSIISLVWKRVMKNEQDKDFESKLAVYGSGLLYEGLNLIEDCSFYVSKLASLVGVVHALAFAWKLLPPYTEELNIRLKVKSNGEIIRHSHAH